MNSSLGYSGITRNGLSHSEIHGSTPACGSPWLIATCYVLHRLLAPRHPPFALSSLITKVKPLIFTNGTLANCIFCPKICLFLCVVVKEHPGPLPLPPFFQRTSVKKTSKLFVQNHPRAPRARHLNLVGLTGLEPVTLRLSSACSNQLSYRPSP